MLRTPWIQNPVHVQQCILWRPQFFCTRPSNRSYMQNWHKQEFFLGPRMFTLFESFSSHCSSGWVPTSSAKVFVQDARAHFWTLAACQNANYPQGSWWVIEFKMQERCHKLPRDVLYKCTYVPYSGTFGASNQRQTLDVQGWHPSDVNAEVAVTTDVTTSSQKIPRTSQDISIGISVDLLDHTG